MKIRPIKPFLFKGVVDGNPHPRGVVVDKRNVIDTSDIHGKQLVAQRLGAAVGGTPATKDKAPEPAGGGSSSAAEKSEANAQGENPQSASQESGKGRSKGRAPAQG